MPIKLLVRFVDEDRTPTEHAFDDQEIITIGRDSTADLTLFDDEMMVSRLHARLERLGSTYHLTDLGSRNFSTIAGERLNPGQPYPINDGDVFHIANYEVQFKQVTATPAIDYGETRFDVGFVNPFFSHASTLTHVLEAMQIEYDKLPDVRREAALTEAFSALSEKFTDNPVFRHLAGSAGSSISAPPSPGSPPYTAPPLRMQSPPYEAARPFESESPTGSFDSPGAPAASLRSGAPPAPSAPAREIPPSRPPDISHLDASSRFMKFFMNDQTRLDQFLDVLMDYVSKQVKVPWQFRYEFIGHTFIPTADSKAVYESDAVGLTNFLFDESSDRAELERRFELVRDALKEGLAHQMGMLDGYRAAVNAGTKLMIDELDPKKLQEETEGGGGLKKRLAFLSQNQGLDALLEKHAELANEDVSVLERRTYRPAFIKAYLERTTSG